MTTYPLELINIPDHVAEVFAYATAAIPGARLHNLVSLHYGYEGTFFWETPDMPPPYDAGLFMALALPFSLFNEHDLLSAITVIAGQISAAYRQAIEQKRETMEKQS
jgi:hypothetical protein